MHGCGLLYRWPCLKHSASPHFSLPAVKQRQSSHPSGSHISDQCASRMQVGFLNPALSFWLHPGFLQTPALAACTPILCSHDATTSRGAADPPLITFIPSLLILSPSGSYHRKIKSRGSNENVKRFEKKYQLAFVRLVYEATISLCQRKQKKTAEHPGCRTQNCCKRGKPRQREMERPAQGEGLITGTENLSALNLVDNQTYQTAVYQLSSHFHRKIHCQKHFP